MSQGQETVWQTGKQGVRLAGMDRNKTATLTAVNGMLDLGTLSLQTGNDINIYDGVSNFIEAPWIDELITNDGLSVTTTYKGYSAISGSEIEYVYKINGSNIVGATKFEQGSTATGSEFSYMPSTKTITLPLNAFSAGDVVIVQYKYKASGTSITSDTDHFSKTAKCVVDLTTKDICSDSLVHSQIELPRSKVSGTFEIAMGDSPTVHNIEIEGLTSACLGTPKELFSYRVVNPSE